MFVYPRNQRKGKEVIQAKRRKPGNTVGNGVVQKTAGAAQRFDAPNAVVVTTSSFTSPAKTAARQADVELIDGDELERLHRKYMDGQRSPEMSVSQPTGQATAHTQPAPLPQPVQRAVIWFAVLFMGLVGLYIFYQWAMILS